MKRRLINRALTITTGIAAVVAVAIFLAIIAAVLVRGFSSLSWSFITQPTRGAGAEGGILYQIAGTMILIATSIVISVPIAAGIGIVLQMYCAPRTRRWLESILHALNGVPSIVFGLVGFAFFFKLLAWRKSWLAGGLLLAVMILPTLVVAFVERLRAIPRDSVLASIGLGLGRGDVVRTLLLPRAAGGLFTGTLLGLARAAGETAPIMFTAAIFSGATLPSCSRAAVPHIRPRAGLAQSANDRQLVGNCRRAHCHRGRALRTRAAIATADRGGGTR